MKKIGGIFFGGILVALVAMSFVSSPKASAAACANVSSFGSVSIDIPKLPEVEGRVVWVRMQSPSSSARLLLEINGNDCQEINTQDQPVGTWTWQAQRQSDKSVTTYNFSQREGNVAKVIGVTDGVRVDRILVTDSTCIPQDFGNNCLPGDKTLVVGDESAYTVLSPVSDGPLQGKVRLSNTPERSKHDLAQVTYVVAGKVIQQSSRGLVFDTTRIENGSHTVYITTTLKDGQEVKEMIVVQVDNPENPLTPVVRWVKLNQRSLEVIGLTVLVVILVVAATTGTVYYRRKRRERTFHGL